MLLGRIGISAMNMKYYKMSKLHTCHYGFRTASN